MLRSFLSTTLRGLLKNKPYFLINTIGLGLGVGGALIIFTKIWYELSFDRFHTKAERIYRINSDEHNPNSDHYDAGTYYPVSHLLRNDFSNMLESVAQVKYEDEGVIAINEGKQPVRIKEKNIGFVEPQFIDIFDFCTDDHWLAGNPKTALTDKNSVVLTRKLAQKYFRVTDNYQQLLGKRLLYQNKIDLEVMGVIEDFPSNTDFPFNLLIPYAALEGYDEFYSSDKFNALADNVQCYVLLANDYSIDQLAAMLPAFAKKYMGDKADLVLLKPQPLSDIHFNPKYGNFLERVVRYEVLWGLSIIAILLVITACINFVNLATAQSVKRSKEVGIRKVLGSSRQQLVIFFLGEAFIITLVAVLIALGAAEAFLLQFHDILDVASDISLAGLPVTYLFLCVITILVTLLAGLYPAWVLSAFQPLIALKNSFSGKLGSRSNNFSLRKGLVIVQFAISQILIIGTLVVSRQMEYFQQKSLGFDKDAIVLTPLPDTLRADKLETFKNQLLDNASVQKVSFNIGSPTAPNNLDVRFKVVSGKENEAFYASEVKSIDADYVSTFDLKLVAGKTLSQEDLEHNRALVNETLVKTIGFENPESALGEQIAVMGGTFEIAGVVKDFHMYSFHEKIKSCILLYYPRFTFEAAIKIQTKGGISQVKEALSHLESVWSATFPNYVFDYQFLDDYLDSNYEQENKTFRYFQLFSALAILIGGLGLYGLVSFMAEQKTKEVGIRKVLGASVSSIIGLFSKEYFLLIILAFLIAAPLGYYFMSKWLENFSYRIDIHFGVFVIGIFISMGIAFLTVGYKSYRAASANPVDSLKDE